jgi:hypothetical protein
MSKGEKATGPGGARLPKDLRPLAEIDVFSTPEDNVKSKSVPSRRASCAVFRRHRTIAQRLGTAVGLILLFGVGSLPTLATVYDPSGASPHQK